MKKRKYLNNNIRSHWKTKSRDAKEKNSNKSKTIINSKKPGRINSQLLKNKKTMNKNSERIFTTKMLTTLYDKWNKKESKDSKNSSMSSWNQNKRRRISKIKKNSSKAMPKSVWKNGNQMAKTFILSSNSYLQQWSKVDQL